MELKVKNKSGRCLIKIIHVRLIERWPLLNKPCGQFIRRGEGFATAVAKDMLNN